MSISKIWTRDSVAIKAVLRLYRTLELKGCKQIAIELNTTEQNVQAVLNQNLSKKERRALSILRYSAGKIGRKNPMFGKNAEQHPNWKGECDDQKGYLTIKPKGKRIFVHHHVMLPKLGILKLPKDFVIHHIDNDPTNNDLDNLALCTNAGHRTIHALQRRGGKAYRLRQLKIAEALKYLT
jgi:predicted Fe-Mo cluster-binding NifX family protein